MEGTPPENSNAAPPRLRGDELATETERARTPRTPVLALAGVWIVVPEGTPVVKAFNTTFAATLVEGEVAGQQLDVLLAGDDDEAMRKVSQLVSDGGLRPIDAGPLRGAQQLEQLGFLHIALQQPRELNFGSTVKLHP